MSGFVFKKGDLVGVNARGGHIEKYLITQVIRENILFYCICLDTKCFHFVVFDPTFHFLLCPEFDLAAVSDVSVMALGDEFFDDLVRLFSYDDKSSKSSVTDD